MRHIHPTLLRAGRCLAGWTQRELAKRSGVSLAAVNNAERSAADTRGSTSDSMVRALGDAGVVFIADGEHSPSGGPGVRLRESEHV